MGKLKHGNLGVIQGKVGDLVVASWKGLPYVRSLPKERKSPLTEKEIANRKKWAMAHAWLQPVTKFVREGFRGYGARVEGFVAAKSYLLKNAFEGEAPDYTINPALMKVSFGELPLPDSITVTKIAELQIQFTWNPESTEWQRRYDQVMLLAYDIENGIAFHKTTGELRKTGSDVLQVRHAGRVYHLYAAFVAADRSRQSDSVYLGTINM